MGRWVAVLVWIGAVGLCSASGAERPPRCPTGDITTLFNGRAQVRYDVTNDGRLETLFLERHVHHFERVKNLAILSPQGSVLIYISAIRGVYFGADDLRRAKQRAVLFHAGSEEAEGDAPPPVFARSAFRALDAFEADLQLIERLNPSPHAQGRAHGLQVMLSPDGTLEATYCGALGELASDTRRMVYDARSGRYMDDFEYRELDALRAHPPVALHEWDIRYLVVATRPGAGGEPCVPLRAMFEALGGNVRWDATTGVVVARPGATGVVLGFLPGALEASVDTALVPLSPPMFLHRGRAYVSARFLAEHLELKFRMGDPDFVAMWPRDRESAAPIWRASGSAPR